MKLCLTQNQSQIQHNKEVTHPDVSFSGDDLAIVEVDHLWGTVGESGVPSR